MVLCIARRRSALEEIPSAAIETRVGSSIYFLGDFTCMVILGVFFAELEI